MNISLLWDKCPRVPWLSDMRVAYLVFKQLQICLPEWLYHSTIPPAKSESQFLHVLVTSNFGSFIQICIEQLLCTRYYSREFIATRQQFVLSNRSLYAEGCRQVRRKSTN